MFGFFRKRELDKSVKKEEDQRKSEIEKKQAEMWDEWLAENPKRGEHKKMRIMKKRTD